jgi:hypothetical protein
MSQSEADFVDRRAAIEAELRDRLARDRDREREDRLRAVSLVCLQCRQLNASDAHFCKQCGQKFNALVVSAPAGGLGPGA